MWFTEEKITTIKKIHKYLEERNEIGKLGRAHVEKNYNFATYCKKWNEVMLQLHEEHGSCETRKNYKSWDFREIT